jgi:hypothetical protein
MKEADRIARNDQRILTLYPTFANRIVRVIKRLEAQGFRPRIQDAWRSPQEQKIAFDSGHSKLRFGFHNITNANGKPEALAIDLLDDDVPSNPSSVYMLKLAAAAEAEGLCTGIRWGLPIKLQSAIDEAIANGAWDARIKIGWDPLHVQSANLTVSEARLGKRPL